MIFSSSKVINVKRLLIELNIDVFKFPNHHNTHILNKSLVKTKILQNKEFMLEMWYTEEITYNNFNTHDWV